MMILFTQSTAVFTQIFEWRTKKILYLLQFFPEVAQNSQNSLSFPRSEKSLSIPGFPGLWPPCTGSYRLSRANCGRPRYASVIYFGMCQFAHIVAVTGRQLVIALSQVLGASTLYRKRKWHREFPAGDAVVAVGNSLDLRPDSAVEEDHIIIVATAVSKHCTAETTRHKQTECNERVNVGLIYKHSNQLKTTIWERKKKTNEQYHNISSNFSIRLLVTTLGRSTWNINWQ